MVACGGGGGTIPTPDTASQIGPPVTLACYTDRTKARSSGTEVMSNETTAGSVANTLNLQVLSTMYNTENQVTTSGSITSYDRI